MQETYDNLVEDIIAAKEGNPDAMEKLIKNNEGLIWSIVYRFKERGYELEDLYQIGVLGFIKCIKNFDTAFEVRLSTYAVPYILGEIRRYIRDNGPIKVSRGIKELGMKILEIKNQYLKQTGEEIKIEKIAEILKISKEEISLAIDSFNPVESIYSNAYKDEDDNMSIIDKVSSNVDEATIVTNRLCVRQLLDNLKDKEKQIIMLRYYKGNTQAQVAKILGISQVQVSRLEKKILENMKLKLAI